MDDLKVQGTEQAEALSILTGQEEAFSLKRLISRLYEMKTQDYWNDVLRRMKEGRRRGNRAVSSFAH